MPLFMLCMPELINDKIYAKRVLYDELGKLVIDFELHKTDHTIRFYIITTVMFNKNRKAFFVSLKESHKWFR